MRWRSSGFTSLVLIIMAISSLVSMFLLWQIDGIINGVLYSYGLRFSGEWAVPYWTLALSIFGIGWFNIISAIGLQVYILVGERREARTKPRRDEVPKLEVPTVQKGITDETAAIEQARVLVQEIGGFTEQGEIREPVESQTLGQVRAETEAQKATGGNEPVEVPWKQDQETQPRADVESAKSLGEASASPEGLLEQKPGPEEGEKGALVLVGVPVAEEAGLTDAEELIYSVAEAYFHPSTKGRSFRTDFPGREFKQRELRNLYVEKKMSKEDYVEALIQAFPSRLEEDVSDKILDYLDIRLQRLSNTKDSLVIVEECRLDKEKWNVLWQKICKRYERELRQEALAA